MAICDIIINSYFYFKYIILVSENFDIGSKKTLIVLIFSVYEHSSL